MRAKGELVRLALGDLRPDGARAVTLDRTATMPGRGAYLCKSAGAEGKPSVTCLQRAVQRKGLGRALRASKLDVADLLESVSR